MGRTVGGWLLLAGCVRCTASYAPAVGGAARGRVILTSPRSNRPCARVTGRVEMGSSLQHGLGEETFSACDDSWTTVRQYG